MNSEVLDWLQKWFESNCNDCWEHNQNIIITNLDNPGWDVTIKLSETPLEQKPFSEVKVKNSPQDWYFCLVTNGEFRGAGGPLNLVDILKIFRDWVKS